MALHRRMDISNGVLVQAACYKHDHSALLAALRMTEGRYRGVALIGADTDDSTLQQLHDGGVRGIRFNFMGHLPSERNLDQLRLQAQRIKNFGWHVLLHGQIDQLLPVLGAWKNLDVPMIIDHMARVDATKPINESAFQDLETYLKAKNRWIKLSGVDRVMQGAAGPWAAALPIATRLLQVSSGRAIWGTDWPHPNIQGEMPDDMKLLDFVEEVCGDAATKATVLSGNPQHLYF